LKEPINGETTELKKSQTHTEDSQCTNRVTMRHVHVTIAVVEKQ